MTTVLTADLATVRERVAPILDRLAATAAHRELARELPYAEVTELIRTGFGALRLPAERGGGGASIRDLLGLVIDVAAADSNVAQALRAHFGIVEQLLTAGDEAQLGRILPQVAAGAIIGNAFSEAGTGTLRTHTTTVRRTEGGWVLDGEKYYSTGTLYADLVATAATIDEDHVASILIPVDRPGVELADDWDGFGQRLSASGATRFHGVHVADTEVLDTDLGGARRGHLIPFFQLYLAATLAGIARNVSTDVVALVNGRTRTYGHASADEPRHDPLVQQVVGEIASHAFAAEAIVLAAAGSLDAADSAARAGAPDEGLYTAASMTVAKAQLAVARHTLAAAQTLFDAGSASATARVRNLDRHWRNARTLASHNPLIYKPRVVGDHLLNGAGIPDGGFV